MGQLDCDCNCQLFGLTLFGFVYRISNPLLMVVECMPSQVKSSGHCQGMNYYFHWFWMFLQFMWRPKRKGLLSSCLVVRVDDKMSNEQVLARFTATFETFAVMKNKVVKWPALSIFELQLLKMIVRVLEKQFLILKTLISIFYDHHRRTEMVELEYLTKRDSH